MKERVVYVDDEIYNLKAFKRLFHKEPLHIITFDTPFKALKKMDEIKPAVVISDQKMPEMNGVRFLEQVKNRLPDAVRILLTGFADLEIAISAINQGNVFRFIKKPWDDAEIRSEVAAALEYHDAIFGLNTLVESLTDRVPVKDRDKKEVRKLAAVIRRELSQPVTIIEGYAQMLKNHVKDNLLLDTYISNVLTQVKKIDDIARKITAIAR